MLEVINIGNIISFSGSIINVSSYLGVILGLYKIENYWYFISGLIGNGLMLISTYWNYNLGTIITASVFFIINIIGIYRLIKHD